MLALGRPRDAVEIGARGLQVDPGNLDGRLMVARAFAALHQWKEAQAELLKVVKTDRNHGGAFRMLGEVLMRRADYERALPVLQHAQNLNPADPSILGLLRRARAGQTLDPPPPIPTPLAPGSGGRAAGRRRPSSRPGDSGAYALDELPTRVAGEIDTQYRPGAVDEWEEPAVGRVRLERVEQRREGGRCAPMEAQVRRADARGSDQADRRPVEHHLPPPTEDVFAPLGQDPVQNRRPQVDDRSPGGFPSPGYPPAQPGFAAPGGFAAAGPAGFAPPHQVAMSPPGGFPAMQPGFPPGPPGVYPPGAPGASSGVRPRVVSVEKPRDAAQASLRQSAAVGEQYLNNLLLGGLLDIPRVRVPEGHYDVTPGRRWGRSTFRIFVYLFVTLFMSLAGAGAWYWYANQQRSDDVERHIETALPQIDDGEYEGLIKADQETRAAVERDRDNLFAVALLAHVTGLEALLYGEIKPAEVQSAIELASQEIDQPDEQGFRELVLARAAHALVILPAMEQGGDARLAEARRGLEQWLAGHKDDHMARWLLGHTMWAGGDRKGARAAFEAADKGGAGPALAAVSLADMMLDEGEFEKARAIYDRALKKSPRHPWAFIGRSLSRSERSAEIQEAVADVNVGVAQKRGPKVEAWKQLAMASAYLVQQDFEGYAKALDKTVGVVEPRFLARLGLLRVHQGQLADAAKARSEIRWYADKPQPDPLVIALDAELRLASGMAREAFAAVQKEGGLRAAKLRGRALFDLGRWEEALPELDQALQISPKDLVLQVWAEATRMVVSTGGERNKVADQLDSLGRQSRSKAARVPQGVALSKISRATTAREKLEQSLADVTSEYPNSLAYRAHVELARLDMMNGQTRPAAAHVEKALELNAGYLPAHDLACQLLFDSSPDKARQHCEEVVKADVASADAELAFVRSMTPPRSAEQTKAAADALRRAKQKGAPAEVLQGFIPDVDPGLFQELGVEPRKR
ncbi:MAG TPA: tetratricopeptide repeat protein [Kofleriaceae bacterium]|nr:tetratricopeptide repeat protein [Kofleriaceae bacterium]